MVEIKLEKNVNKRKLYLTILITGLLLVWIDFFARCLYDTCSLFGIFDMSFLRYHLVIYPVLVLSFWIVPLLLFPEKWRLWLACVILTWTLNDFLWFLVIPQEWIKFWQFKGEVVYKFYLIDDKVYIPAYDWVIGISIIVRSLIAVFILRLEGVVDFSKISKIFRR